ncbi:MAG TPA: hypothetical protein VN665_03715, partial [Candidatus Paceibacterota bacterium]|nr:hypothetical protein [Candidatus Paceibacterota bacterium]
FAAKFLIACVGFFILAAGAATYLFLGGGSTISPNNIDIQVVAPSLVDSGKQGAIQVVVSNHNTSALTLVDMLVDYPDGTRDPANPTQALSHVRDSIGTINSGQQIKQNADGIFYGAEGSAQKVTVTLEYSVAGSNAVFEKSAEADFRIGSSPISLSIKSPDTVVAGQSFPVDITVQSNATTPLQNVVVQGQYPFGFTAVSSTPQAAAGGTFWQLGTMQPGSSQVIHLMGSINGQDGDAKVLRFVVGSNTDSTDTTIEVPVLTVPQTVTVQKPFITASIAVNGQSSDGGKVIAVAQGTPLQGVVTWTNNLSTAVTNAQFTLTLSGPALDKNSVNSSDGFYQSAANTITWSPTQDATLANIPPGGTGQLQFSFATLAPGTGGTLVTNPTINLSLDVSGTNQNSSSGPQQVSSVATANVSIASQLSLTAQAFHFTGPIPNTGPMPPVAEQNTSYTIQWTVKNSSNTIGNAIVSAVLPPYVRYVSAGASGVSYDGSSRTVTWNLGDLPAGVGYSTAAKTVDFQVVLTPSTSQAGSIPQLTGPATLKGQDRYAQVSVESDAQPVTTQITEAGFGAGMETVLAK